MEVSGPVANGPGRRVASRTAASQKCSQGGAGACAPWENGIEGKGGRMEEPIVDLCLAIAAKAHAGQVDKAGADYIEHPRCVSARCATTRQKCAALLHDVLEDTPTTAGDLIASGVPADVVAVVRKLTRPEGVGYMDYVHGVAGDPDARAVKMGDLTDNMDLSRLSEV